MTPLGPAASINRNQLPSLLGDDDIISQSSLEASSICSDSVENRQIEPRLVPTTPPRKPSTKSVQSTNSANQARDKQDRGDSSTPNGGCTTPSSIVSGSASKKNSSQKKDRQKKGQSSPSPFAERSGNRTKSSVSKLLASDDGSAPTQATANSHSASRRLSFHERGGTPPPRSPDDSRSKSTPRRLLKKLFCTSQREKAHPFILSDIDSFTSLDEKLMARGASRRSRPGEFPKTVGSFPTASHTLSEVTSFSSGSFEEGILPPQNHPEFRIASQAARSSMEDDQLLPSTPDSGEFDPDIHHVSASTDSYNEAVRVRNDLLEVDPTKVPLPASPGQSPGGKLVPVSAVTEILQVSSSGSTLEDIFLPHSSSSESDLSPPPPPFPLKTHKHRSPGRNKRSPGGVPTLNVGFQRQGPVNGMSMARAFCFPDVPTMSESPSSTPRGPRTPRRHRRNESAAMDSVHEDDEAFLPNALPNDSAFLPDDFDKSEVTYTWEQVQNHIQEAEERLRIELEEQHAEELQNVRDRADYMLNDQASRLKAHAKSEAKRMDALLKEERNKAQLKHMELIDKVSSVSDLKQEAERATSERGGFLTQIARLQTRIQELEERNGEQQMKEVVQMYQKQLQAMQEEKAASRLQVQNLQEQLRESKEIMSTMEKQIEAFGLVHERESLSNSHDVEDLHQEEIDMLKSERDEARKRIDDLSQQVEKMRSEYSPSMREELNRASLEKAMAHKTIRDLQGQLKTLRETELTTLKSQLEAFTRLEAVAQNAKGDDCDDPATGDVSMLQEHLQVAKETVEVLRSKLQDYVYAEESLGGKVDKLQEDLTKMTLERDNLANEVTRISKRAKSQQLLQDQLQAAEDTVVVLRRKLESVGKDQTRDNSKSREFENLTRERDQLRNDIETLGRDFGQHLQATKQQAAEEIKELRRQLESAGQPMDGNAMKQQANVLAEEKEKFKARLDILHEQHAIELEQARIETEEEAEERLDKFRLHVQEVYEEKDKHLEQTKASRDELQRQVKELLEKQANLWEEAKQEGRQELEPQLEALTQQLNAIRQESETELADVVSKTCAERDLLRSQLAELKELHLEEVNAARKAAEKDSEMRVHTDGRDHERIRSKYEADMNEIRTKHERQLADQQAEIEKLKRDYEGQLERVKSLAQKEIKLLHQKLQETSDNHYNERSELSATLAKEQSDIEAEKESMRQQYESLIEKVRLESRNEVDNEIKLLRAKLDMAHVKYEREKFEIVESCEKECDELREKLVKMRETHMDQLAKSQRNNDSKNDIRELERQLQQMQDRYNTCEQEFAKNAALERSKTEKYIKDMQTKFQQELHSAQSRSNQAEELEEEKMELTAKVKKLETQLRHLQEAQDQALDRARAEAKNQIEKELRELEQHVEAMQSGDSDLLKKIAVLEASTQKDKTEYEQQIREVRAEHGKEIEELLGQLDLVEQEHLDRYSRMENVVGEKEAVISALGKQLAEAQTQLSGMSDRQSSVTRELEAFQEEALQSQNELQRTKQEMERLQSAHKRALEQACNEAKEEMIARAEVQFEQANATYKKLKQEYDNARTRISNLERDLKTAKRKADDAKKADEARKVDLEDELAQAKACKYQPLRRVLPSYRQLILTFVS